MVNILIILSSLLAIVIVVLLMKIYTLRKAADEIRTEFAKRLDTDTNVGIDISTADKAMRRLAMDIDAQLRRLRKAHIRYERGDKELKDAVTNIAHDLRTPLTAIYGYLDLLQKEEVSEPIQRYLGIIGNRIDAMTQLTEELFKYSVLLSVPVDESRDTVTLNHAIEECVAAHYGMLKAHGIVPDIRLPDALILRRLNRIALSRILGNILTNAVKYSDGDLCIQLTSNGAILFQNHAKQLDTVHVGRLFDRFYTVENGQNGTGLGLSIAKMLTEQMGGSIEASKAEDVFTVALTFKA